MTPQILNTIGLTMGMIGVAMIYFWGPPLPDFEESVGIGVETGTVFADGTKVSDIIAENAARKRKHQVRSGIGLAMIFFGFAVQLVAVWSGA